MIEELNKLRELTETLTGNGYLRDQAEEWEYALDAIPDYVYMTTVNYKLKFLNKLLLERLNIKDPSDVYDKLCFKVVNDEDAEQVHPDWENTPKHKMKRIDSVYLKNMKGWFDMTRSPVIAKTGKLIGFICVLQDVSEKRKALKDLVAREAVLETIFNSVPIGMGMLSADRVILSINKHLCDLLGYVEEELIGQSVRIFYPSEEEYERVGKIKANQIRERGVGAIESKFKTKAGKLLDVYIRTSAISGSDRMVYTVTDITLRKRREIQLKLNEERLRSVLKLSTMDHLPDDTIMEYALEEAVRITDSEIGYLHFVTNPQDDLTDVKLSLFKWSKAVEEKCTAVKIPKYPLTEAGCWADSVRTKQPVVHNDYQNLTEAQGKKGLPDGHFPLTRHMSVPIIEGGKVRAVAGVGNKATPYDKMDMRQLKLFMNSMWSIISNKQSREEILRRKEYFERLIESTPMGVFVYTLVDGDLILGNFNPAGEKILNIKSEDVIGKRLEETFPNLVGTELVKSYREIALGGDPITIPAFSYKDHRIDGVFSVFAYNCGANEVAVFFADATEKEKLFQKVRESEQKYKLIAENLEECIWTFDTDMNFTFVSSAVEGIMGYTPEEWVGKNISEFTAQEELEVMSGEVIKALSDPEFKNVSFESKMIHKDGHKVDIIINAKPIYVSGTLVGFQGRTREL